MPKVSALPDWLLAEGRTTFTVAEAARLAGTTETSARHSLARLQASGAVFSPTKGFYFVVPPSRRRAGQPAVETYVDALMRHLGRSYYVGWVAAASMHGATHHAPQWLQVAVTPRLRLAAAKSFGLEIHESSYAGTDAAPVERRSTATGSILVATKELTAVDLSGAPQRSGGVGNVAAVITGLGGLDLGEVARLAAIRPSSTLQRLGYLLSINQPELDLAPLIATLEQIGAAPVPLDPRAKRRIALDPLWNVYVNANPHGEELGG